MNALFGFHVPPWELILRGSCIYWFIFILFRFILRRDAGSMSLADILLVVVIADAAQNGMAGDYKSISEGLVLMGTIAFWNYLIDWLSFRYPWFARFAEPQVVPLVRHGRILRGNLRREMLTIEELESQFRQQGIEHLSEVKHAFLEADGHLSVIKAFASDVHRRNQGLPGAG